MPATYTHAKYGKQVLALLSPSLQETIQRHLDLYNIGLHGPDILFFYKPLSSNKVKELGYDMHKKTARTFFNNARQRIVQSDNPEASLVYILGFINHFVLDSECHGYIREVEQQSGLTHSEIESEFDKALMIQDNLDPSRTLVTTHLHVSLETDLVIAPFFGLQEKQIDIALNSMIRYLNLFVAPTALKRKTIFSIMKLVYVYDNLHGLIISRDTNPICQPYVNELLKKYDLALATSVLCIEEFVRLLNTTTPLDTRYDLNFE